MQHPYSNLPLRVVQTLVLYALCEHQLGQAKRIVVSASGGEFTVSDNGRGHSVARTVEGAAYLDCVYTHLEFPFGLTSSPPVQLQGLGMSLLNQMCARLDVTVRKSASTLRLSFQQGRLVKHEQVEESNSETGNSLSGVVIPALAQEPIDAVALSEWLGAVQLVNPSLELIFNGRQIRGVASGA